ncbi:MAG: hypothetical protein FJZ43_02110 [Candidatus Staskawiczbacteria bacterium]|nr:hypothetical protein [Candidatus Staskawiczbacteria bacterium]
MEKKIIIIDGFSLLYRAFHALPPLANKNGQPTGAVYGFLLTLFRAIKDTKANYVVACFDTKKPTFRHVEFKDYKIHRPEMPQPMVSQISIMKDVLESFSIPIFQKEGFEADDLIATISQIAKKEADVYIVSGDLDNLQLVDERVKVYTLGKGIKDSVIYDSSKVLERFLVEPSKMNDLKALTGDASDNIPGVPGIGKKTAAELIQKYGSVKNLYEELLTDTAVLKPKIKEALKQNKESAFMSLSLVETKKDVPIDFNLENCKFGNFDKNKVKNIFTELGFNSLIDRVLSI